MVYLNLIACLSSFYFLSGSNHFPNLWWDMETYQENMVRPKGKNDSSAQLLNGTVVETDFSGFRQGHFLYFNGSNAGFIFNSSSAYCLMKNSTSCVDGFTLAFWVKWSNWGQTFIIASPSLRMQFFTEIIVPVEVIKENESWVIFHKLKPQSDQWEFYTIVFNTSCLEIFVNAVAEELSCKLKNNFVTSFEKDVLAVGLPEENATMFAEMYLDDLMIWNKALKKNEIENIFTFGFEDVKVRGGCSTTLLNKDRYLHGHIIQEKQLQSVEECLTFCLENVICQSFNFEYNGIGNRKICILNSLQTRNAPPLDFMKKDGYIYYDVEKPFR